MNVDQQILDHLKHKYGSEQQKRALNEQYRYTPPYPTLHLEDFIPHFIEKVYSLTNKNSGFH